MGDVKIPITIQCEKHHQALVNGLWNFVQSLYGVDFYKKCGKHQIRAHKLILDVFLPSLDLNQVMFPIESACLPTVVEFLYTGRITVQKSKLNILLAVARKLNFEMLIGAILSVTGDDQDATTSVVLTGQSSTENKRTSPKPANRSILVRRVAETADAIAKQPQSKHAHDVNETSRKLDDIVEDRSYYLSLPPEQLTHNECIVCGRSFFERDNLKHHQLTHQDDTINLVVVLDKPSSDKSNAADVSDSPTEDGGGQFNVNLDLNANFDIDLPEVTEFLVAEAMPAEPEVPPPPKRMRPNETSEVEKVAPPPVRNRLVKQKAPPPELYPCTRCSGRCFTNAASLQRHVDKFHESDVPFKCDTCAVIFKNKYTMDRHFVESHMEKQFKCNQCPMKFPRGFALRRHQKTHVRERQLTCSVCRMIFASSDGLAFHMQKHKRKVIPSCNQVTSNPDNSATSAVMNAIVPATSSTRSLLRVSNPDHPSTSQDANKPLQDFVKLAKSQTKQRKPVVVISGAQKPGNSGKGDSEAVAAVTSILISKGLKDVDTQLHVCSVCGRSFTCLQSVKSHEELHKEWRGRRFWCNDCGRGFTNAALLRHHSVIHHRL